MNDFEKYYFSTTQRAMTKYPHYLELYERHFSPFRGKSPCVVEIGVGHGGSLQMWKHCLGEGTKVYGIDIQKRFTYEEKDIEIITGDQGDLTFLGKLKTIIPKIDILIDDGSHMSRDQIVTFENLFPLMNDHGVYFCEDVHYSYRPAFYETSYIKFSDYIHNLADYLAGELPYERGSVLADCIQATKGVYFYICAVVVERGPYDLTPSSPIKVGVIPMDQREETGPH